MRGRKQTTRLCRAFLSSPLLYSSTSHTNKPTAPSLHPLLATLAPAETGVALVALANLVRAERAVSRVID